jgi:SAM-dependent methyltransferase
MLDWTGERFVPWAKEAAVAYEHLHRYAWVCERARNKRVLDLASGEGYGSAMLARFAAAVTGIDADGPAIQHARRKYVAPNLSFLQASIHQLPLAPGAMDLVVCFEALEHIEQQQELLNELKRVLAPGGVFAVSTPNKEIYRTNAPVNPYHVKELSFEEFDSLLKRHFRHVAHFAQRVLPASSIWAVSHGSGRVVREFSVSRQEGEFRFHDPAQSAGVYFIALASDAEPGVEAGSVLLDHSNEFYESTVQGKDEHIARQDEGIAWLRKNAAELQSTIDLQAKQLEALNQDRGRLEQELQEIHGSRAWKCIVKLRRLRGGHRGSKL